MTISQKSNIVDEFKYIDFHDKRLNARFEAIIATLNKTPSGLISKAFIDADDQKAAYRFFENDKVNLSQMLEAHQRKALERCADENIILAVQDSTSVHLTGAAKVHDIGNIGDLKKEYPGLNIHTTILLNKHGTPLGIGDLQIYERKLVTSSRARDKKPALEKQSGRWLEAVTNVRQFLISNKVVWIADREGDFWDYFTKLISEGECFVQRAIYKRVMQETGENYFDYVQQCAVIGEDVFEIDSRGGGVERKKRTVTCEIRTAKVAVKKPKNLPRETSSIELQIIYVKEKEPMDGDPIEWFLVTNMFTDSFEEVLEKVKWYRMRWAIEELHRVVKSGCGVEEMRLGSKEKLTKLLFLLFVVGLRILWITKMAKERPDDPCTKVFTEEEWKILYVNKHKEQAPEKTLPTIKEAVRLLAILGGFYAYNKKRDPGTMTIWRGLRRLAEAIMLLEVVTLSKEAKRCG